MTKNQGWTVLAAFAIALALVIALSFTAKGQSYCPTCPQPVQAKPARQYQQEQPTVADVKVTTLLGGGVQGSGSGTAIAHHQNGTVVLTNYHVVAGGTSFRVCVNDSCYPSRLIGTDKQNDVALLLVPTTIKVVAIAEATPSGQVAQFRGFDGGQHFRAWNGRILGYEYDSYLADTYSVGGNSGGGVYVNGRLVGVIWGNRGNPGKLAFTGVGPIRKLLARVGVGIAAGYPERIVQNPQPAPPQQPSAPPARCQECDCREQLAKLADLQADLVLQVQRIDSSIDARIDQRISEIKFPEKPGPAGPPGPKGPQGEPGKDGTDAVIDEDAIAERVAQIVLAQMEVPQPEGHAKYYVLVADDEASYWDQLSSQLKAAQEGYSKIKVAQPPNYSVGALPQLVEYQSGKPLRTIAGSHNVSTALSYLARGATP